MGCVNRGITGLTGGALTLYVHSTVGKGFPLSPGERGSAAFPPPATRQAFHLLSTGLHLPSNSQGHILIRIMSTVLTEQIVCSVIATLSRIVWLQMSFIIPQDL